MTPESCRYVAGYVQKKLYGKAAKYDGRVQPFSLKSNGLGKKFALDNEEWLKNNMTVYMRGKNVGMPKYYVKVFDMQEEMSEETEYRRQLKMAEADRKGKRYSDLRYWDERLSIDKHLEKRENLWKKESMLYSTRSPRVRDRYSKL